MGSCGLGLSAIEFANKMGLEVMAISTSASDVPDIAEVVVNSGNHPCLVFVAANFRKEVTSSALWLLGHGIQLQCFKVTPFALGDDLLLNADQIIPPPEAKDFMIGIAAKGKDEEITKATRANSETLRPEFWALALESLRASDVNLFNNINPTKDHWLSAGSGLSACPFTMIFSVKEIRVEFYMSRAVSTENKFIFDSLLQHKAAIEDVFGESLEWQRLDDKKACRIQFSQQVEGYNQENWPQMIAWLVTHVAKLETALAKYLIDVKRAIKA